MKKLNSLGLVVALLSTLSVTASAGELAVIVHVDNPATALSPEQIRKLYLDEQLWTNGEKVRRFYQGANTGLREAMCNKVLERPCPELERHFGAVGYQKGLAPEKAGDSASAVVQFVKLYKGSMGIVEKGAAAADAGVRVVHTVTY